MQIPQMLAMQQQKNPNMQPAGFLDQVGTRIGDAIMGANNPFGALDVSPQQRQQQIGMALLKMAGDVDSMARRGGSALEGLGTGITNMQQQGQQGALQALQAKQIMQGMKGDEEARAGREKMNESLRAMITGQGEAGPVAPPVEGDRPGRFEPGAALPQQGIGKAKRAEALFWLQAGQPEKAASAIFGGDAANWTQVTTEEGVFMVNPQEPSQKLKIGERPTRNEGEGRGFTQASKLREEFTKANDKFMKLRGSFEGIKSAAVDDTGASDMALIYQYMKMLDPGSTVMVGEYANASNTAGVPDKIVNLYNKAIDGTFLNDKQRGDFVNQAGRIFNSAFDQYDVSRKSYAKLAKESYNINPDEVTIDLAQGVGRHVVPPPAMPGQPDAEGWITTPSGVRIRKKTQ